MALRYSSIIIESVQIINNEARDGIGGSAGGGISCYYSNLFLKNVSICNNEAAIWWGGGGIAAQRSNLDIVNSTISKNDYEGIHAEYSDVNFINSILWNNQGHELNLNILDSNRIVISHSDIEDSITGISINNQNNLFWLGTNINMNPEFVNPNENNCNLLSNSPCIDMGIQDTFLLYNNNTDTLYIPQLTFLGSAPDMGAFEFDPATILVNEFVNPPNIFELYQNYPNPFNSQTSIEYYLPQSGQVKIEIYNVLGQKVKSLVNHNQKSGMHQVVWNGRDENNKSVSSGVYIYNLTSSNISSSKKLLFLK